MLTDGQTAMTNITVSFRSLSKDPNNLRVRATKKFCNIYKIDFTR